MRCLGKRKSGKKGGEEERKREKTTVPHECTQSRSVAVRFPTSIPRCCGRPYVRASRCYDPISIPPWAPRPLAATPSVPLSKSTERSLTRAVRRAQPPLRPHRDLTVVVIAEKERVRSLVDASSFHRTRSPPRLTLRSPRTSPSHASPISPSSLLRRLLHLLLLLHRPTSRYSRIDLLPQQLFTLSPSSSHRCRRRIRGSYRRVPLPSGRFPPSRFEAACCGRPLPAAEGQRDALSPLLACSLRLARSHPFRFSFV